mgnify:CR=1 FL=1
MQGGFAVVTSDELEAHRQIAGARARIPVASTDPTPVRGPHGRFPGLWPAPDDPADDPPADPADAGASAASSSRVRRGAPFSPASCAVLNARASRA